MSTSFQIPILAKETESSVRDAFPRARSWGPGAGPTGKYGFRNTRRSRTRVPAVTQSEGTSGKQRLRIVTFPVLERQQKTISMKLKKKNQNQKEETAGVNNHVETSSKAVKS